MQPSHVYAITAGSAVLLFWIYTCCAWLLSQLKFWLPARPLPYLIERRTYWGPIEYHELAVVLLYTGVNTFAATLQVRSTEDEDVRAAQMAVFNYTLAFVLLASVHISKALGLSDIQRTGIVLVVFLMAILQAVCHIVLRALRQPLDSSSHSFIWGCVAGASMIGILLFYLLRRWLYEMCQLACHALAMLSVYGLWQHCESVLYQRLVECVAAIWLTVGLCLALRVLHRNFSWRLRSSRSRTTLKIFGDTATMILRIPVFRSWVVQPGQYVLLGVPSASRLALVPHPFMVAYWDADHQGRAVSIDLLIAARKGFSRDLLRLHGSSSITSWIDGPYGAACQNFASYNTVMLVASGMGIAALIPYVKEIVHRSCRHQAATSDLCILWEADEHFDGDGDPVQKWLDECIKEDLTRPSKQQILSIRMFARSVKRLKNQQTTWDDNIANIYPEIGRRLDESRGKTLVLVSGNPRLRDRVRGLVRVQGRRQAKFQALPYQPWIEQARPSNSLPAVIELQE